jgi:hypothetical protein
MPRVSKIFCGLVLLAPLAIEPADAAVLLCEAPVEGRGRQAPTEAEARRAALADWQAKAGDRFVWRLATNKGITCLAAAGGGFVCKASGHPCTLRQKPPDGPLKRLAPSAPGSGI